MYNGSDIKAEDLDIKLNESYMYNGSDIKPEDIAISKTKVTCIMGQTLNQRT